MQLAKNFYNKLVLVDGQQSIVHGLLSTVACGLKTIVFLLSITITFAQNFPVRVTPSLTPPYTPFLTDYTDAGNEKLTVQILLNDITISEYRCKLRLSIEGVNISITTNPNFVPLPLVLSGGVPQIVYGSDLSEYFKPSNLIFQGINQNEFERKGSQLPEGIYRISIEVLDYNRGTVVSNKGSATAWMILNDPPFINLPVNNAKIRPLNPQNLVFQWTPRHRGSPNAAFTTEYEVKLVEIWPAGRNPYDAINTSRPIFETTVDNTLVVYGPAETPLVLGREYALQVRAKDTSGKDLFKNNGYSEVIRFIYGDECPMPSSLLADDLGTVKARMRWQGNGQNSGYVLRYREKKQGAQWFEEHTDQTYASTTQLKAGATYEYQVCGECEAFRSAYTKEETFTTLKENPNAFVCGDPNAVTPPDGSPPLPALFINDFITAGGFDMVVTQASGTNGRFSGEGLMIVPYFNGAKVRVTFKNISVNKSYQLTDGEIVTVWDANSKSLRVEEKTLAEGGGKGLEGLATFEADTLVRLPGAIRGVSTNSEGDIVVETNNGSVIIDKEKGKSYAIADEVGNGYLIDKDGKITKTTATDAAIAGAKGQREYSTDPNLSVTFSRAGALTSVTHYGFDEKREGTLEANYQQTKNGKWIGWKALPSNQTDIVKVTAEGNTDLSKVYFRVEGLSPQDVPLQAEQLTLTGSSNDTQQELLAYYPQADTSKEDLIVGKLNTISYDAVQKKLVLVKVNSTVFTPTAEEIKTKLNEIFRQGVVSWDEVHIEELSVSGISTTSLDDGESGLLSNYTAEMRQVINAYTSKKALAPDTYYLFLAEAAKNPAKLGYMPRKKQAGFIFTKPHNNEELIQTIAHELGHGAFRLEHTFGEYPALSQGTTDNLMDYNRGTRLNKYQWDYMHNPVAVLGLFEGDEEGALMAGDPYFKQRITRPNGKTDNTHEDAVLIQDEKDQTIAFILPDEKVFFWVDEGQWEGYFENGLKEPKGTYLSYVEDKYMRRDQPISWGIYLAARDLGGFAIDLVESPVQTSQNLATGLYKIATLQFDIEKTWERVINADKTDGAYVVATLAMGYLAGPKGKAVVAAEDAPRFGEMVGEYASKLRPAKLTWPQLLALFKKARQFEALITTHLKTLYPIEQGYTVLKQVYVKVDGVMSIADNIIYNSKTGQFILNETKYGATNLLRKNQQIIQDAIKAGKQLEIRTAESLVVNGKTIFSQGSKIKVSKILRSNSIDGTISSNTVTTIWP